MKMIIYQDHKRSFCFVIESWNEYVYIVFSMVITPLILNKFKSTPNCPDLKCETKHFHSDILVFTADIFRKDFQEKVQFQGFFGVGAQHQNSQSEHAIQTTIYMACTFMIHILFNWSERGVDDIFLWYFVVDYTVWIYNWVPNIVTGLTPMELLIQTKNDNKDLLHFHILG